MDLWAAGPDELFIVGWEDDVTGAVEGVVLHRVAGVWDRMARPRGVRVFRAVHGSVADGSVFAVGNDGQAASWDGAAWTVMDTGAGTNLHAVHVFAADDVYAAGDDGAFVHFDGTDWARIPTGTTAQFRGVWGASSDDLWLVGPGPTVLRYRGGALEAGLPADLLEGRAAAVSGVGDEVYALTTEGLYRYRHDPESVFP